MPTSTNACKAIAATAKDAATASVRGENPAMKAENWRGDRARRARLRAAMVSASIAAISRSMQRAEGTPRDSLKEIVSASSSRTRSAWRARAGSLRSASSTRWRSRRRNVPAAYHGSKVSISVGSMLMRKPRLSWPTSINSRHPAQLSQLLARVEHARLYRVLRNADDLRHLFDGFLVVVDQIDHFPVFRRQRARGTVATSRPCRASRWQIADRLKVPRSAPIVSSSRPSSRRLRNIESALKRAMAMSQVETALLPSNRLA